jgi:hypothetical protein
MNKYCSLNSKVKANQAQQKHTFIEYLRNKNINFSFLFIGFAKVVVFCASVTLNIWNNSFIVAVMFLR